MTTTKAALLVSESDEHSMTSFPISIRVYAGSGVMRPYPLDPALVLSVLDEAVKSLNTWDRKTVPATYIHNRIVHVTDQLEHFKSSYEYALKLGGANTRALLKTLPQLVNKITETMTLRAGATYGHYTPVPTIIVLPGGFEPFVEDTCDKVSDATNKPNIYFDTKTRKTTLDICTDIFNSHGVENTDNASASMVIDVDDICAEVLRQIEYETIQNAKRMNKRHWFGK